LDAQYPVLLDRQNSGRDPDPLNSGTIERERHDGLVLPA
jgi:hypothetical protein